MSQTMETERVRLVRDADGAWCGEHDPPVVFDDVTNYAVPWRWRNSQAMHERGTGHTMILFRYAEGGGQ